MTPEPDGGRARSTRGSRWRRAVVRRWSASGDGEDGMSTAEYAVGTVAACAFAAVLYQVVTGGSVVAALGDLVQSALTTLS
jgi:Protein of unknown function (DUF4244)